MDTSRARFAQIQKALNNWAAKRRSAQHLDYLLHEALKDGYTEDELGDWLFKLLGRIEEVPYDDGYGELRSSRRDYEEPVRPRLGIHELANQMTKDGYFGQMMRDEDNAKAYICMAADNPNVEDELPPAGFSFWRAAPVSYKRWKALKNHGFE